ncbi:MAG: rhomboid family protein [Verrucomicrobiales bacterium]|nr:rhomboid family protein [Verrucomicrobiales bacterium]
MSGTLSRTTCRIHFDRPASARCPGCQRFYCVECITEHDGKMTCASCLAKTREAVLTPGRKSGGARWFQPMPLIHALLGLIVVWALFYLVAQTLTGIPDKFHDGTIWDK